MTRSIKQAPWLVLLALLLVFSLAPFEWMLVASLKPGDQQLISGNPWWADNPYWANYTELLTSHTFQLWLANTALVLISTLAISLVASLLAGYALAYMNLPYSRGIVAALFATYLLPQGLLFLPLVSMLSGLHLLNSSLALILTYPSLVIPFGTWVLWSFFRGLPRDLVDQASVEGAHTMDMLLRVVGPLAAPALAAVLLFGLAIVFNDYFYAFAFVSDENAQTLVAAVGSTSVDISDSGFLFAAITIGVAPVAVLCAFFADVYARGLGAGVID
jgi:multiple sugar transport system permease protein